VENTVDVKVKIASLKGEVEAGDKRILSIQEKWKEARTELEEGERNLTEKKDPPYIRRRKSKIGN